MSPMTPSMTNTRPNPRRIFRRMEDRGGTGDGYGIDVGNGGGGGIRTHGALRLSGFQDRRIRPLCHPSG